MGGPTGPDLTEGVDESALTANALWEAVTGKPGEGWIETVHVMDRSEAAEKKRKADNDTAYADLRERAAKAKKEPLFAEFQFSTTCDPSWISWRISTSAR